MRLPILVIHICGGVVGLLSGVAAVSFRKGSPRHRMAGNIFFISMLTMASTGPGSPTFKPDKSIFAKIFSSLTAALGVLLLAGLLFVVFVAFRWLPESAGAPQVGQKAPDFTLTDTNNKPVTLAQLLTEPVNNKPPRGVLLIFYRGYW